MSFESRPEGGEGTQAESPPHRSFVWWIVVATGWMAAAAVGIIGLLTFFAPLTAQVESQVGLRQAIALLTLAAGLGALSGWLARSLVKGSTHGPFSPKRIWPLWAVLLILLVLGVPLALLDLLPSVVYAALSAVTMALLPAVVLGTVGRAARGGGTWRDAVGGLVAGASVGTGVAAVVEIGLIALAVGLVLGWAVLTGRVTDVDAFVEQLRTSALTADVSLLRSLLNPAVLLGALVAFAGLVPLVEEMTKTLAVGLLGRWLRPSPARAFLLGVASGAGFAFAENVLNVSLLGSSAWLAGLLNRLVATLMHCATGGLMGWGWGQAWSARKPGRLALAYLGAVGIHALWNSFAVGAMFGGVALAMEPQRPVDAMVPLLVMLSSVFALSFLALTSLGGMIWAARALAHSAEAPR